MATARKLSRQRDHRQQLQRNLLTSLVMSGHIVTTEAKAKFIKPWAEKLIGWARSKDLTDQRRAASYLTTDVAMAKLVVMVKDIPNVTGAVRLVRTAPRVGDNAPQIAVIIRQNPAPKKDDAKKAAPKTAKTVTKSAVTKEPTPEASS